MSSSTVRHPNSPTLCARNNTDSLWGWGRHDWPQLLFSFLLYFFFVSLSIPVLSALLVSPQPCKRGMLCLLLAIPSYECKLGVLRHQRLCIFWKLCSGRAKSWLAKSERGLETPAPDCVGSARLPPLCCKVNGHRNRCDEHFANGAGSFSNSSVCSEKPSHEDVHGRGQLWLVLVTRESFCNS